MADANDSKSFGKPCGFESHHRHFIIKQLRIERFWAVFLFCPVSYTLVFSGKILTMAFAEDTLLEKSRCV